MRFPYILERVLHSLGPTRAYEAERALVATAEAVGESLPDIDREPVADALPPELAAPVRRGGTGAIQSAEALYARVAERTGANPGRAREFAQVACRELGSILTGEAHRHLVMHAPADLAELFEPARAPHEAPARPHPREHRARPLSEASPGSRSPLSESRPHGHAHSVAESDDPHGESKLSSGHTIAEEEGDTLARGRRGSKRPLADRDE